MRNIFLLRKEKRLFFEDLYVKPQEEEILGSFVLLDESEHIEQDIEQEVAMPNRATKKHKYTEPRVKSKDIRTFFTKERDVETSICTKRLIQID